MVLMDQPFAALVKELFDIQKYPELPHPPPIGCEPGGGGGGGWRRRAWRRRRRASARRRRGAGCCSGGGGGGCAGGRRWRRPRRGGGGGRGAGGGGGGGGGRGAAAVRQRARPAAQAPPAQMPYDVTGWTLPIQMGVEVVAVARAGRRRRRARTLRKIERVEPIQGKVEGSGPVFAFSHNSNAALRAVNDILAAGGTVSFAKSDGTIYATGNVEAHPAEGRRERHVAQGSARSAWPVKKPRIGIYEPWSGNIDEGWTRWILEQFHFPFTGLHNADMQAGHLREQFDTIVFAEMGTRQIMDGMRPGTVPGQYAGGIGEDGAQALRDFVTAGGTLVTLGNATPVRHRAVQPAGDQRGGGPAAGPVLLLGLAAARGDQGAQASGGGGAAAEPGGDVRAQPGVRHASRRFAARCWPVI